MIIVIDDERTFKNYHEKDIIYLRTNDEAFNWITKYWISYYHAPFGSVDKIEEIWFDHDLGDGSEDVPLSVTFMSLVAATGMPFPVENVWVHSQNPVGAAKIALILNLGYKAKVSPLPDLKE